MGRLQLQVELEALLGSTNVYFQPPNGTQISYPCIVYERDNVKTKFANNKPYKRAKRYLITVIDRDPEGSVSEKVEELASCSFVRSFKADGLNHDLYNIYL